MHQVVPSGRAFTALRRDGSLRCWGDAAWGGRGHGEASLRAVRWVVGTSCAFAAVLEDDVVTWGDPKRGDGGGIGGDELEGLGMVKG